MRLQEYSRYTLAEAGTRTTAQTVTEDTKRLIYPHKRLLVVLDVTDCKAAADDHLDVYVDFAFEELYWLNACHFTQLDGDGADAFREYAVFEAITPGTSTIDASSNCAESTVRPTVVGNRARCRHTVTDGGAHGQSFTFSVVLYGF